MAASRGVIYVAVGDPAYRALARESIASLRRSGWRADVAVICDDDAHPVATARQFGPGVRRLVVPRADHPFRSRAIKTRLDQLTPFDESLYLDCDTLIVWPIDGIWDSLRGGCDVALALDPHPTAREALAAGQWEQRGTAAEWDATRARLATVRDVPYYNGGVLLWRRTDAAARFFAAWHAEWKRFRSIDQFALVRALAGEGHTVATLPPRYNTTSPRIPDAFAAAAAGVSVLHFCPSGQQPRMSAFAAQLRFDVHLSTVAGDDLGMTVGGGGRAGNMLI